MTKKHLQWITRVFMYSADKNLIKYPGRGIFNKNSICCFIRHSSHIVANLKQFSYKTKYFNLFIEILNQNLMKKTFIESSSTR